MAGEKKGKAYEALVHVALQDLIANKKMGGPLHWNVTPKAMSIEPDFMTGSDENDPKTILLLTHSNAAGNSHMKFWRNLGELVEAKTVLPNVPRVYCLTFGVIKEDLEPIQEHAFDQFIWVRQATHPWADELDAFIAALVPAFPKGKDEQASFMRDELRTAPKIIKTAYLHLSGLLETMHKTKSAALDKMWTNHRARTVPAAPAARNTSIRRGASKLYLFPNHQEAYQSVRNGAVLKSQVNHLEALGLVTKRASGYFPSADPDLMGCCKLLSESDCISIASNKATTSGFRLQAGKVLDSALLPTFYGWCASNWTALSTQSGMKAALLAQHANPSSEITIPKGSTAPGHVWLMDVIGAIFRAAQKKSQSFGFSSFSQHPKAKNSKIGNMHVGTWVSCFMNQFFTRKAGFTAPMDAIDFTALVLSEFAKVASKARVSPSDLLEHFLTKEYEAVYLAHRGFDPLWGLISGAVPSAREVRIETCYVEAAGISGISGSCTLAQASHSIINWQSAHGSHTNDKKKELCGRAIGLRHHWNGSSFVRRPGIQKMILILDGTWKQADLNALLRAGWDEIFYPDEMNQLAKAIV